MRLMTILITITLVAGLACDSSETPMAIEGGEGAKATEAAPEAPKPVALDEEIVTAIKSVMSCEKIDHKCDALKAGKDAVKEVLKDNKRAIGFVDTVSVLLNDEDEKVIEAASHFAGDMRSLSVFGKINSEKATISGDTALRLVASLEKTDGYTARRMANDITLAATLAGKSEELVAVSNAHSEPHVKTVVTKALMTNGRMGNFETVKQIASTEKGALRNAALEAPLNMHKWTDAEAGVLCPWAVPVLKDDDVQAAALGARLMVRCRLQDDGKYIDLMLAEGRKRADAGEWKRPFNMPFRDVCFGGIIGTAESPSEATCNKTTEMLEWVANHEKVEPNLRAQALSAIYYQQRNQKTYDLLTKYKNSPIEEIKESVAKDMATLEKTYLKK